MNTKKFNQFSEYLKCYAVNGINIDVAAFLWYFPMVAK